MSGRYDYDKLRDKIEQQIEKNIKEKKEKESKIYQKKLEKIKISMNMEQKEDLLKNKKNEKKPPRK